MSRGPGATGSRGCPGRGRARAQWVAAVAQRKGEHGPHSLGQRAGGEVRETLLVEQFRYFDGLAGGVGQDARALLERMGWRRVGSWGADGRGRRGASVYGARMSFVFPALGRRQATTAADVAARGCVR